MQRHIYALQLHDRPSGEALSKKKSGKNKHAEMLGKLRAETLDSEHQQEAAKKRWAGHQKCQCGKCAACYQRAYRERKKKSE
jgi:hypothetical protein